MHAREQQGVQRLRGDDVERAGEFYGETLGFEVTEFPGGLA
jgi:catechol 2,3-dioxygenase-like lactoylglutathione lyase family enzyme